MKNLTWHDINIVSQKADGTRSVTKTIPSDGIARVFFETKKNGTIDGVDIFSTTFGETQGLPASSNTCTGCHHETDAPFCDYCKCDSYSNFFIVSKIVAEANPHRDDLLIVSETVRDGATIIGCKWLARLS